MDRDDAKYLEYMRQPYLPDDRPTSYFSLDRICDFFEKIVTTPIKPVAQRYRGWLQPGRWILVKRHPRHPFPKPHPIMKVFDRRDGFLERSGLIKSREPDRRCVAKIYMALVELPGVNESGTTSGHHFNQKHYRLVR